MAENTERDKVDDWGKTPVPKAVEEELAPESELPSAADIQADALHRIAVTFEGFLTLCRKIYEEQKD